MGAILDHGNARLFRYFGHVAQARTHTKRMLEYDRPGPFRQPLGDRTGIHVQLTGHEIGVHGLESLRLQRKHHHATRHPGENDFIARHEPDCAQGISEAKPGKCHRTGVRHAN
jgi:hypothetical protein